MYINESEPTMFGELDHLPSLYLKFELAEGICLSVLSVLTVFANIFLLLAIWKDPYRSFRSPTTYFIIGLGITDLLTGATTAPFFAIFYITRFLLGRSNTPWMVKRLFDVGQPISTVTISSSYLIILFLSVSQYIAIKWPHKYKILITRHRVITSILLSWMYFICFTLVLHLSGIDTSFILKVDLAIHPILISTVLFVNLILLYRAFIDQVQQKGKRKSSTNSTKASTKTYNLQRQFTVVTLYLAAILLISALPHIAVQFIWLYAKLPTQETYYVFMALRIRDLLLFLKVALDAFIYAWRLPAYRQALKGSLQCSRNTKRSKNPSELAETLL
ncbi:histamine H2 receptor-like [Montipora capricornis]|uniref:histamine H2 receptor-like n=1 Tax=Montipora foliosa TaxID=591990 RepID=UPI0035F116E2